MFKELSVAALTALSINTSNTSISEYQNVFTQISTEQKTDVNKEEDFSITQADKQYLRTIALKNLENIKEYKYRNEEVFKNNFEKWLTEESDSIDSLVTNILKESQLLSTSFKQEAKYYKKHPSISKQLLMNASIWDDIYIFTFEYKVKAQEAKKTHEFMVNFIEENQQVLEALA